MSASSTFVSVAVIGLGAMGSSIADRLMSTGHDMVVWNRTRAKCDALIARGARAGSSPKEAARHAEVVFAVISDGRALREITEGPHGVLAGATRSTTIVQMSTVGREPMTRLASKLPSGVEMLDAPVLGSVAEAASGSLTIFVGGASDVVERWTPLLSDLGSPVMVGPLGAGTAAKLVANASLFGAVTMFGEALSLGTRLGLPMDTVFEILGVTPLKDQVTRRRAAVEQGEFPRRFSLRLARKDAELITDAVAAGPPLSLMSAVRDLLVEADADGWGDRDYTAIIARILDAHRGGER
jgi:3-hydroxyisobutyrate dehydrogenase/2-hydroxy-3-oxopropionate reductase